MDGPHDLGGKQGFGPIDVGETEVPFHHDWEGRMWAIAQSAKQPPDWTIDWWRHVRELIDPVSYLSRPYFDSWAQAYTAAFINSGTFSVDELLSGRSAKPVGDKAPVMTVKDVLARVVAQGIRFDGETDAPVAFRSGDRVRTASHGHDGHTRLPAYARDRVGIIHAYHGAHILPDASAQGEEVPEHLYSVVFEAGELWGEAENARDRVYVDLWERYLEAA